MIVKESYTSADTFPIKVIQNKNILSKSGKIRPYHIQLYPTNVCNLSCPFCSCSNRGKTDELPYADIKYLIKTVKNLGCKAVTISGGGEPTLHPDINKILKLIVANDMQVGLTTNGLSLFNIDINILNKNVTWLRVSHSDNRTFTENYENKLKSILSKCPTVDWGFSYVVTDKINYPMLTEIINFANNNNAVYVRLVSDLLQLENISDMQTIKNYLLNNKVDDSIIIYQGRKQFTHGRAKCLISLLKPVINADGTIHPCCIDATETVLINVNGLPVAKRISELQAGELTWDNGKIEKIWKKSKEEILRITLDNGRLIDISKDHTMLIGNDLVVANSRKKEILSYKLKETRADKLKIRDLIPVKYLLKHTEENAITMDEDLVWLLGQYVADGCSSEKHGTQIEFKYGLHAIKKLEKLETVLKKFNYNYKVYKRRTGLQTNCYSKELYNFIKMGGQGAINKRVPPIIFSCNRYLKELFFRSYFSGDGHLGKPNKSRNGYSIILSTVSKQLASDLTVLLATLGIVPTICRHKRDKMKIEGRTVNCHDLYRVKIGGNYNFSKLTMFPEIKKVSTSNKSPKRALGFLKTTELMFVPIKSIEKIMSNDLYDIKVEKTNMFFSSFGILTHNCGGQYASETPDLACTNSFSMGKIEDLENIYMNQRHFDGSSCFRCYYDDYNVVLDKITTKVEHEEFL
jgi:intein/homing endonuclease/molybdenum cofactor biosynthesis enzyme MoaA